MSVAFNNQEELIIDCDVLTGNDMEIEVIKNHEYSELPIVIAGTTNVVEVSDPEISRGARGIKFLMLGEPVPRCSELSKKSS